MARDIEQARGIQHLDQGPRREADLNRGDKKDQPMGAPEQVSLQDPPPQVAPRHAHGVIAEGRRRQTPRQHLEPDPGGEGMDQGKPGDRKQGLHGDQQDGDQQEVEAPSGQMA
jgi:hypothetical protein